MTSWRDNPPPWTDLSRYDGPTIARAKALAEQIAGVHPSRRDTLAGDDFPVTVGRLWVGYYADCIVRGEFDTPTSITERRAVGRALAASQRPSSKRARR